MVLALAAISWLVYRSLPDYSDSYQVEGINGELEIVRDSNNVPHIFGESDDDVFFGLGFVHAQDRLWQITMLRRAAQEGFRKFLESEPSSMMNS